MNRIFNNPKVITKWLTALFYILILIFIILYIKNIDFDKIRQISILWPTLIAALGIGVIGRYWSAAIWMSLIHSLGVKNTITNLRELLYIFAKSWMGKYIPGTLPWILGKIYFASKLGISKNKLAIESLFEASLQIFVFISISLIFLISNKQLTEMWEQYLPLLLMLLIICATCAVPPIFNIIMSLAYKTIGCKKLKDNDKISTNTITVGIIMFIISSFINGFTLFLITKSVDSTLDINNLAYITATGNLATAIGMLAIFAPAGIGVHEAVQFFLLSIIINAESALIVVILSRVIGLACDLIFWMSAKLIRKPSTDYTAAI